VRPVVQLISHFCPRPPAPRFYALSLHDALPILARLASSSVATSAPPIRCTFCPAATRPSCSSRSGSWPAQMITVSTGSTWGSPRSEEHTSELQSRENLVCRLLLEKKHTEPAMIT